MQMQENLIACVECGTPIIEEERDSHLCFSQVKYVGYISINGKWFVSMVSKDGFKWTHLERPLPVMPKIQASSPTKMKRSDSPTEDDNGTTLSCSTIVE